MIKDHDDNAKLYIFDPLSSITVYELAQILKHLKLMIAEDTFNALPKHLRANFHELETSHDNRDDYHGA